jgi:hypothetical protein
MKRTFGSKLLSFLLTAAMILTAAPFASVYAESATGSPAAGYPFLLGAAKGADNSIVPLLRYAPGEKPGTLSLAETPNLPLAETFRQYETKPSSEHPDGVAYFWIRDDAENLYVVCDWTSDDTYDDGEDYFTLYLDDGEGLKAYTQYSDGGEYGAAFFTSSEAADFDHMIYVIAVPKAELSGDALKAGFELYGTASTSGTLSWNGAPPSAAEIDVPVTFSAQYETDYHYKYNTAFLFEYDDEEELEYFLSFYLSYDQEQGLFYNYYTSTVYEGNIVRLIEKTDFAIPGEYGNYNLRGTDGSGIVNIETTFTFPGTHKVAVAV